MSDTRAIWEAAERQADQRPTTPAFRACSLCAQRRPADEVYERLAKFKAIVVSPPLDPEGKPRDPELVGVYPPGDIGYRSIVRCRNADPCRAAVEAFGEVWPLDDHTGPSATLYTEPKPAVEVAPDPPAPGVSVGQARGPEEPEQAPADDAESDGWF